MGRRRNSILIRPGAIATALLVVLLAGSTIRAQWPNQADPLVPRGADGKPNLLAPTPRASDGHPDLSGVWLGAANGTANAVTGVRGNRHRPNIAIDLPGGKAPLTPWAQTLLDARTNAGGRGLPTEECLPFGLPPSMLSTVLGMQIVQTPTRVVMLLEEFNDWRQIHLDGRTFPAAPEPSWLGYSVGRWEQDTLVVETRGFNDRTWLDGRGTPHSEQLLLTERYRRRDIGHMDVELTFNDAKAFTREWSVTVGLELMPVGELLDNRCENEKFVSRVGRKTVTNDSERPQP